MQRCLLSPEVLRRPSSSKHDTKGEQSKHDQWHATPRWNAGCRTTKCTTGETAWLQAIGDSVFVCVSRFVCRQDAIAIVIRI